MREPMEEHSEETVRKADFILNKVMKRNVKRSMISDEHAFSSILVEAAEDVPEKYLVAYAELLVSVGKYRLAKKMLESALKNVPGDKRALNALGLIFVRRDELEKGIEHYERALGLDPDYEPAWFNKGKALFRVDELEQAEECFRKAVALNENNISAWNNLGLTLKLMGDIDEAIECYRKALGINEQYHYAWSNLGYAYIALKNFSKGLECFEKALEIKPDYDVAKRGKAMCEGNLR